MNTSFPRLLASLPITVLIAAGLSACGGAKSSTAASSPSPVACTAAQVEVIVEHQAGAAVKRCVSASGSLSALTVMQKSGLQMGTITFSGLGAAVCQIDREPATYSPKCFDNGNYWAMFVSHAHAKWTTPPTGVSSTMLSPGDSLGWRYESQSSTAPPAPSP